MDHTELRASLRVTVTRRGALEAGETNFPCIVQDMSDEGLLFICTRDVEIGQILEFSCEFYPDQPFQCKLEVVHITNGGVGARIVDLDEKGSKLIHSFLEDRATEKLRRWM
jgi:hypothetical protein